MHRVIESAVAEQATGCRGAGAYRRWAELQGYPHLHVVDTTSSAGDWTFVVSKDGLEWFIMSQENRWPRAGFEYSVNEKPTFRFMEIPTEEQVMHACGVYMEMMSGGDDWDD